MESVEKQTNERLAAVEERLQDKIDKLEENMNATAATQAVINAQQTGVIGVLQSQVQRLNAMTQLYISQPVMAASEAALNLFKSATATTTTTAATAGA